MDGEIPSMQDCVQKCDSLRVVGSYSLRGLALEWDNCPYVRARLRKNFNLLIHRCPKTKQDTNHKVEKNIFNVRSNAEVLKPVLRLVRQHGALPSVDHLIEEVEALFALHSMVLCNGTARDQAWAIRHLISSLKKNKAAKKDGVEQGCIYGFAMS